MTSYKMTPVEYKAIFSLSMIMSLRMLGLFMVLPLFTLYASHLPGATPFLIGLALGIYGLTQAILQIPFGTLSDRFGRKPIITLGLCIFILGSLIAATSHNIWSMLLGRTLQGAGAVGSTMIALLADLTRPQQRTQAMAITGITIGASFALAVIIGPITAAWFEVSGIFWLAALFGVAAIILLLTLVPTPGTLACHSEREPHLQQFSASLRHPELVRLNIGIFLLHLIFTASFVVIPISLHTFGGLKGNQQWVFYLPTLSLGFLLSLFCIRIAERKQQIRYFFIGSILLLVTAEFLLWIFTQPLLLFAIGLLLFFSAFSLLEAFLPSLISRTALPHQKGAALGIYSCSQFLGIFGGGISGGWLYDAFGPTLVYLFCAILAILWSAIAFNMKNPQYSTTSH